MAIVIKTIKSSYIDVEATIEAIDCHKEKVKGPSFYSKMATRFQMLEMQD